MMSMMMPVAPWAQPQLLTVGRINCDLYSEQTGAPMQAATTFRASVGGSPTNIAIAACRLGLPAAVLTGAGRDPAGDLVVSQLAASGVDVRWVARPPQGATSLALLATLAPDDGQRQFYRDDPADIHLDPSAMLALPWHSLRVVVLSADALARGTTPDVVAAVAAEAARRRIPVWWDLDLRESNWPTLHAYASVTRAAVRQAAVVLGTEAEFAALLQVDPGDLDAIHGGARDLGNATVVVKTGAHGATLYRTPADPLQVPAAPVSPVCTVGGGDALAGALVRARCAQLPWHNALEFAMAAAGWTVSQPGCSQGFPTLEQLNYQPPLTAAGQR
jgi:5-dehydro-2-deoxygluconokinase